MARRVSWTNNSSGHSGTYVYRSTATMDPQALPAPIGTVVAGTTEYVDSEALADGTYYYRVQDYQGASVSAASAEQSFAISSGPDFSTAQVGDAVGGGIYAGINTESDNTQYHIIFALQEGELAGSAESRWKTSQTNTAGTTSYTDGWANTQAMEAAGLTDHPAALYCRNYTGGGNTDWYLPAKNELALEANIRGHAEMSTDTGTYRWSSTEYTTTTARVRRFSDGNESYDSKDFTLPRVRPVRRVAV